MLLINIRSIYYLLFMIILVFLSTFVLNHIEFFPDFQNYNQYIEKRVYIFSRFIKEPVSASFMYLSSIYNYGAYGFYYFVWYFSIVSTSYMLWYSRNKYWHIISTMVIFNPINLILFETPRQYLAVSLFIILLLVKSNMKKIILLPVIFLTHNITGLFVLSFYILSKINSKYYKYIFSLMSIVVYYYVLNRYGYYLVDYGVRGRGRILIYLFYFILFVTLLFNKKDNTKRLLIYFTLFSFLFYLLSPYFGRLLIIILPYILIYIYSNVKQPLSILIINFFNILMLCVSIYMLYYNLYGY